MGEILQRILQSARRQDRIALRVPSPGVPLRRRLAVVTLLLTAACSNAALDKVAGQGAGAGIDVTTSGNAVTIGNHTTRPLLNVRLTINAAGSTEPFVRIVPTIETNQNQEVRLNDFHTEDGTLLDPAVNAPERISVAARDTLGNRYDADAKW
jgi:hypothetical protein